MAEQENVAGNNEDQKILEYWRDFFQSVMEALHVGVVTVNEKGYVASVNQAFERIFGTSRKFVEMRKLESVLPGNIFQSNNMKERLHKIFTWEISLDEFEASLKLPDGAEKSLLFTLQGGKTSQDIETAAPVVVILIDDVTTERQLQQQVFQSEKLASIGQIAGGMAHEMNTPLASIVFNTQLLKNVVSDEKQKKILDSMLASAGRCEKIVKTLMGYVRPTRMGAKQEVVRMSEVVQKALEITESILRDEGVKVQQEIQPDLAVRGDSTELSQILINFLTNARDAMSSKSAKELQIRAYAKDANAILEVQDTGEGITPQNMRRLFEPFFTTKPVGKGTGLGLTVCKGIAEKHSGVIQAQSQPGQGATFSLTLPAVKS